MIIPNMIYVYVSPQEYENSRGDDHILDTMIKKEIKTAVISVFGAVYGFFIAYFFPAFLDLAFNKMKGDVNNPDGEMFMLFGWLLLALIPSSLFFILMYLKRQSPTKKAFLTFSGLFIVLAVIEAVFGVMVINGNYYVNYTNIFGMIS